MKNFLGNTCENDEKINALNEKLERLVLENHKLKFRVASLENGLSLLLNHLNLEFNHVEPHLEIRKKDK